MGTINNTLESAFYLVRYQAGGALDGAFVYGDYITGTIWSVKPGNGFVRMP